MLEPAGDARLFDETPRLGRVIPLGREHFDGYLALEILVEGPNDEPHSASPDLLALHEPIGLGECTARSRRSRTRMLGLDERDHWSDRRFRSGLSPVRHRWLVRRRLALRTHDLLPAVRM